ncbi:hypothetical protein AMJ40_00995 [candidate division TA06 bacterium DG_26]|uniref:Uncharacterized protein n=1 Tax=candidate division TA06 bacterium DG_26 TaxID=1703771 RepID=A0A0S7WMI6_UNCT6|nr:MAG: hypothetical protein AMJ40_00995 [candidate division TA06 bacterium DG_26]
MRGARAEICVPTFRASDEELHQIHDIEHFAWTFAHTTPGAQPDLKIGMDEEDPPPTTVRGFLRRAHWASHSTERSPLNVFILYLLVF